MTVDIASVVLRDRAGRVLMQLRDYNTPHDPGLWALPGGHVEPGEDPLTAAHRELLEETALTAEALEPVGTVDRVNADGEAARFHVFTATTDATQAEVVCGEGQAMVFLTVAELYARPLAGIAAACLDLAGVPRAIG